MASSAPRLVQGAALVATLAAVGAWTIAPLREPRVALVVLIAVDQMRPDYFDRFGKQFTGGLARIRSTSAFYPRGLEDHANTETAPGHSTMLSGREPVHTGIVSNERGVPDPGAPLVDASGEGASPRRFLGTTLFDWMRAGDSGARVLSVSRKDRGAILPVGRTRGDVYWWTNGKFTTSRYYADTLPAWVRAFNDRKSADPFAGRTWELLRPDSEYAEVDAMPYEHLGSNIAFPHHLPTTVDSVRRQLADFPWMDSVTLAFALDGVRALDLGQRHSTDLLSISLSTTDAVGHAYGPDSREIHDQMLRLDAWLGWFLDSLAATVPRERIVFAFTSDHGVTSFPERTAAMNGGRAGRISLEGVARELHQRFDPVYRTDFGFDFGNGLLAADTSALRARGVNIDSLARAIATRVGALPGVVRVYTPRSLSQASATDRDALRWRHALPPEVAWLVCAVLAPGYVWSDGKLRADHGTLNDDDVGVPIAFMGPGIAPATMAGVARTVDIAPTLAAYLGVRPSEELDGRVLREVLGGRSLEVGARVGAPAARRARRE